MPKRRQRVPVGPRPFDAALDELAEDPLGKGLREVLDECAAWAECLFCALRAHHQNGCLRRYERAWDHKSISFHRKTGKGVESSSNLAFALSRPS